MSKPYKTGEIPKVGDEVNVGLGQGPKGLVVVVVGGPTQGAADGYNLSAWQSEGPGIAVLTMNMELIYEEDPDDETILIKRNI